MKVVEIEIGGKNYTVQLAVTDMEKATGLSKAKKLPKDEGMLFVYDSPQDLLFFTMEDTSIDLDIIFIDEYGEVISVNPTKAHDPEPIEEEGAKFVLEVNINSGIQEGDELEEFEEDLNDEEKDTIRSSKMLVLDENGDVQYRLEGGERIFSRISTRQFIKAAIKAYKSDSKEDYIKVGKLVFKELNAQDSRDLEYVEKPNKEE